MTEQKDWDRRYVEGDIPWETGREDRVLRGYLDECGIAPCRALEFGCGTGLNAILLARRGFDVTAVDISPAAIAAAEENLPADLDVAFLAADILDGPVAGAPFGFALDRGCLHSFDTADDRRRCARAVAENLGAGGWWLSMIGSADGPDISPGPPRLTAAEVAAAVEPAFAIHLLKRDRYDSENAPMIWVCLAQKREKE